MKILILHTYTSATIHIIASIFTADIVLHFHKCIIFAKCEHLSHIGKITSLLTCFSGEEDRALDFQDSVKEKLRGQQLQMWRTFQS